MIAKVPVVDLKLTPIQLFLLLSSVNQVVVDYEGKIDVTFLKEIRDDLLSICNANNLFASLKVD